MKQKARREKSPRLSIKINITSTSIKLAIRPLLALTVGLKLVSGEGLCELVLVN
jgi:hypothetical protein